MTTEQAAGSLREAITRELDQLGPESVMRDFERGVAAAYHYVLSLLSDTGDSEGRLDVATMRQAMNNVLHGGLITSGMVRDVLAEYARLSNQEAEG